MITLLDLMHEPPMERQPGQPPFEIAEVEHLTLTSRDWGFEREVASIQLGQTTCGKWVWALSYSLATCGRHCGVWGNERKFARSREAALHHAIEELRAMLRDRQRNASTDSCWSRSNDRMIADILKWAEGLR